MKSFFRYLLISVGASLLITFAAGKFMKYLLRSATIDLYGKLNAATSDEIQPEVVLLGSSRCERQIIPSVIQRRTGLSCYNYGIAGGRIKTCYNIAQLLFLSNKKIKCFVINVDTNMFDPREQLHGDAYYFAFEDKAAQPLVYTLAPAQSFIRKTNLMDAAFYNEQSRYAALKVLAGVKQIDTMAGYVPLVGTSPNRSMPETKQMASCTEQGFHMLESILRTCRSRGIRVLLIEGPLGMHVQPEMMFSNYKEVIFRVQSIAKQQSATFVTYRMSAKLSSEDNYFDFSHLNSKGAGIYSELVAGDVELLQTESKVRR